MAQQGRAGVALFTTTVASWVGGTIGILALFGLSPLIVSVALAFGPAEYFSIMVFGLVAASTVNQDNPAKGLSMVMLGQMLGAVRTGLNGDAVGYDLGFFEIYGGMSLNAFAIGHFRVLGVLFINQTHVPYAANTA